MNVLRRLIVPSIAGGLFVATAAALVGSGCTARGGLAIPSSAHTLSSGTGKLEASAPRGGTVYVYDATADRIVYSGLVRGGEQIQVDPDANIVTINGTAAAEPHLRNGHEYRIEFDHQ